MSILIDGYNLLNSVGIVGPDSGRSGLERSRRALLNFLAQAIDPAELSQTTVVFDASNPPPGRPRVIEHRGLTVRFAAQYKDADSLLEELIQADTSPRRLTVVSSDHRVQRAARRRRARAVDSDVWYLEIFRQWRARQPSALPAVPARPSVPLGQDEIDYWVRQFGGQPDLEALIEEETARQQTPQPPEADPETQDAPPSTSEKPSDEEARQSGSPFPPGYGDDLLEDEPIEDPRNPFPPGYGQDLEK
jgi:hypothetical protein